MADRIAADQKPGNMERCIIDIMISYWYYIGMPRKIRNLIKDLEQAGFINRGGKGNHRNYVHPKVSKPVTISGKPGDDALPYQEKAVKNAIKESMR